MIIDTHCHLDDISFDGDLNEVLENAVRFGVGGVLIPGADVNDLPKADIISQRNENIFFAVGAHPYNINGYDEQIFRKYAKNCKCIAIGECGLDYFRLPKDEKQKQLEKAQQKRVFIAQLDLAVELRLPVILHIRDANEDSFAILKEYANALAGAVLHCYNASPLLLELHSIGQFYYGIGGVLTFKNAKNLVEILPRIPKNRLLLETDAPYLTPEPYRGKRNEPAYTQFVAKKMAEILDLTINEVVELTTKNAKQLFGNFKIP